MMAYPLSLSFTAVLIFILLIISRPSKRYAKNIKEKKIKYQQLSANDELDFGSGVKFKVFSPTKQMLKSGDDLNNNSLVGQLKYNDFTMMFTGDAEKEAEENMVKTYGSELASLVLKSPHHGSRTSSSEAFLKQVDAKTVLISLGAGNEYGHPHKQTMERYKIFGMTMSNKTTEHKITFFNKLYTLTTSLIYLLSFFKDFNKSSISATAFFVATSSYLISIDK